MITKRIGLIVAALVIIILAPTVSWAQLRPDFGNDWVESNPFMISARVNILPDVNLFLGTNVNTVLGGVSSTAANNLIPWHYMNNYDIGADAEKKQDVINLYALPNDMGQGWHIKDEPPQTMFADLAAFSTWLKAQPGIQDLLVYSSLRAFGTAQQLWGNTGNPTYTYDQYLDDAMTIMQPDVLSFSNYPNLAMGGLYLEEHLNNVMAIRNKAIASNVPYFNWVRIDLHRPGTGDSELRMPVFATLTAGCKGIAWFVYEDLNPG